MSGDELYIGNLSKKKRIQLLQGFSFLMEKLAKDTIPEMSVEKAKEFIAVASVDREFYSGKEILCVACGRMTKTGYFCISKEESKHNTTDQLIQGKAPFVCEECDFKSMILTARALQVLR